MKYLFLQIIHMSVISCYVIIFVMAVRLLLKKCPKIFSYALWAVVLFRLVCPFSFESIFSLIPVNTQAIKPDIIYSQGSQINTGISVIDNVVNQPLPVPIETGVSVNRMKIWFEIGEIVWIVGIILLISYSIFSIVKLYKKLKFARHISGNIYTMEGISSPFVFGIITPKIYLPINLSKREQEYILLHEQKHIQRLDHIIKPLAFLVLSLHWFNPLAWIAFFLMGEDMELSCDESVIKQLGNGIKKEYSSSLLSLSIGRRIVGGCPLAFGDNNTKGRIKNVLNYKKPGFWVIVITVIAVVIIGLGLMTNPKDKEVDLSFLNPDNFANAIIQNRDGSVKIAIYDQWGLTKLSSAKVADWINQTEWKEKKVSSPYELSPTYAILNIHSNDVKSEIRLYESEPTLAMVVYDDSWRYYTINEGAYDNLKFQLAASSYFESFEIGDNFYLIKDSDGKMKLAIDVNDIITKNFNEMMSEPLTSSSPYDYVKANQSIFNEIVSCENSALRYCFDLFEQGGQTDLKGHLMMYVCRAIQPEAEDDIGYSTGQMWYDAFKQRAFELKEIYTMDEIEDNYPTYYFLLNLLTE
ncbi:hypothetical protein JYG23_13645 [Sedimentibacter sp. zth1]|uniref:M56 family metallopeptidase n=1 Tax=Sedimentibacter sp. zth1 TaxID=2816908 RepID=UPI001A9108C2|nr:M56 family metallopeptidase [Sedimentibacter sp. zth1]QSX05690.1 hypothetical protein JYG23_13645 [Sedimentibacter sp. zth1]